MAASPSRPVLPTDRKPGGSSRLSPTTRRRPASVTATDGKPPAPPYRGPGDQTPPCPRGARTVGLASPTVVDRTVRSVTPDGARNDRPAWPGPPRPYKSKHAAPRSKSLAKAASLTRGEAKGHQPGEGRRTPRSCTADAARKREDGQPRQRSSPRSSAGALRGEARTRRTETAGSERRRTDARAANSACPPPAEERGGALDPVEVGRVTQRSPRGEAGGTAIRESPLRRGLP